MNEELIQRDLLEHPEKIGNWDYYNIGSTTINTLKNAGIVPDKDYGPLGLKKPDMLIVKKPNVIAIIEYKQPEELKTKKQVENAIAQEIEVARAIGARIYMVTDGAKTIWINPATGNHVLGTDGKPLKTNFNRRSADCIRLIERIQLSIGKGKDMLLPPPVADPLPLARQVWQDLWSVSGATPENCLYTFVEIFIFKYLSDLGILKGLHSFAHLLSQFKENDENAILEYYVSTIRKKIKELFPAGEDNTTIINGTIFVSRDNKAIQGYGKVFRKILRRFERFGSLSRIDHDFKSKLFESFLKESISKKNWGQFFTPMKVVRSIIDMAKSDIRSDMSICDPACGVGKFLLETIFPNLHNYYIINRDGQQDKIVPKIFIEGYDKGFDKDEQKTIILAKANMLIYFSELMRMHPDLTQDFARLFNSSFRLQTNSILGTLSMPVKDRYDMILTNPPYVTSGSENLKKEIKKNKDVCNYFANNGSGIEGLFLEWIVNALKPGGKAFIVVPDGLMYRGNDRPLRDSIIDNCMIDAVISLPINTFFTTDKKTYILALTKKEPAVVDGLESFPIQQHKVFTYICSEIGESRDNYRFDMERNDLQTAVKCFNTFKGAKDDWSTDDKRCKLFDINDFKERTWTVDRWWTKDECIELGIECANDVMTKDDIAKFADEMSEILEALKNVLPDGGFSGMPTASMKLSEIFDPVLGKGMYSKQYGQDHKGEFPVYSGSTMGPLCSIDSYDFDGEYLTWVSQGLAGYMEVFNGKFSMSAARSLLAPKPEMEGKVNLRYLRHMLEPVFRSLAVGRRGDNGKNEYTKLNWSMVQGVEVFLPVDGNGEISVEKQAEIASMHDRFRSLRDTLVKKSDFLKRQRIAM